MMMPIADARILRALTLRPRVTIKRELQRLCRAHSAAAAFLATASMKGHRACSLEYFGDHNALPSSPDLAGPCIAICEQRTLRAIDREDREVVLLYSRLCFEAPVLVLGLVDSRAPFTDALTDDMEQAVERIESLLVDLLEPISAPVQASSGKLRERRS